MKTILWVLGAALGCALRVTAASTFAETNSIPIPPGADWSFATVVAMNGNTAVVTAPYESTDNPYAGAAYVFVNSAGSWTLQARLTPPAPASYEQFGMSAAINGNTIVIGSYGSSGAQSGAAYVFSRSGTAWSFSQELSAPDILDFQVFGTSVAVSGDTIAVGAFSDTGDAWYAGAVYAFVRSGGTWVLQQKITATEPVAGELLGYSVAIDGDTIAAGAPFADFYTGVAYVFTRGADGWSQRARLTVAEITPGAMLGNSIALSGNTVLCGAPMDANAGLERAGAAYVFTLDGEAWTAARILPSDPYALRLFGWSVAILGNTAIVGSPREIDNDGNFTTRAAYIFSRTDNIWSEQQRITSSNIADSYQSYGISVAIGLGRIIVGDPIYGSASAVYVYEAPLNTAPTITSTQPLQTFYCVLGALPVSAYVEVSDVDGDELTVVWSVNGVPFDTTTLAAGTTQVAVPLTSAAVGLFAGTNVFEVVVSDGKVTASVQSFAVLVPDTQAPIVASTTATPDTLIRSGKMVPVQVTVEASDDCSTTTSRITDVLVTDTVSGRGSKKPSGTTDPVWQITGPLSIDIDTHVVGPITRVYTLVIETTDASGNATTSTVDVTILK
jgi:hypothetical protein